jgi:hypothetical protein
LCLKGSIVHFFMPVSNFSVGEGKVHYKSKICSKNEELRRKQLHIFFVAFYSCDQFDKNHAFSDELNLKYGCDILSLYSCASCLISSYIMFTLACTTFPFFERNTEF